MKIDKMIWTEATHVLGGGIVYIDKELVKKVICGCIWGVVLGFVLNALMFLLCFGYPREIKADKPNYSTGIYKFLGKEVVWERVEQVK